MDKSYCFVLGSNPTLNILDVLKVLENKKVASEILESSEDVLLAKTDQELHPKSLINELGSCQKIAEIFSVLPPDDFENKFSGEIKNKQFADFFLPEFKKINFGISVYNAGGQQYPNLVHKISSFCQLIKNQFDTSLKKVGFLFIKDSRLSSVSVKKNDLLEKGFELLIIVGKKGVYLARTIAVQDFEGYSFRDYGRPVRNSLSGMIPPKLAKMMINFAGKDKEAVIFDPFCGNGTILQEAILLGYRNVYGSDIEKQAVEDTGKNLGWLFENYRGMKKENINLIIKKADVVKLSDVYSGVFFDAIISEPYLGSPRIKYFTPQKIEKEVGYLEELLFQAFKEFKKILKEDGVVVIVFPVFNCKNRTYYLSLERITKLGFTVEDIVEKEKISALNLNFTARDSVIFSRPDQTVWREIFVWRLK